jgi:hypothetical protein
MRQSAEPPAVLLRRIAGRCQAVLKKKNPARPGFFGLLAVGLIAFTGAVHIQFIGKFRTLRFLSIGIIVTFFLFIVVHTA